MASKDFIPHKNIDFNSWQNQFVNAANNFIAQWNLSAAALAEWNLLTATPKRYKMRWDSAMVAESTGNSRSSEKVERNAARKEYEIGYKGVYGETGLRLFIARYIRNNPHVTPDQKAVMRLTVPGEAKIDTSDMNLTTDLWGTVRSAGHLWHIVLVRVPGRKSRAKGEQVKDIMIFMTVTEATQETAPDTDTFAYCGKVSRGLLGVNFTPEQEGMRAWYYAKVVMKGRYAQFGKPSTVWNSVIM